MPFNYLRRKRKDPENRNFGSFTGSSFTTHTFTTCGVNGIWYGPTVAQMNTEYTASPFKTQFSMSANTSKQGIQLWTVPETGVYKFEVSGATKAGSQAIPTTRLVQTGFVELIQGQIIRITVGQQGNGAGGCGGTSVSFGTSTGSVDYDLLSGPLFVCGGGAGVVFREDGYWGRPLLTNINDKAGCSTPNGGAPTGGGWSSVGADGGYSWENRRAEQFIGQPLGGRNVTGPYPNGSIGNDGGSGGFGCGGQQCGYGAAAGRPGTGGGFQGGNNVATGMPGGMNDWYVGGNAGGSSYADATKVKSYSIVPVMETGTGYVKVTRVTKEQVKPLWLIVPQDTVANLPANVYSEFTITPTIPSGSTVSCSMVGGFTYHVNQYEQWNFIGGSVIEIYNPNTSTWVNNGSYTYTSGTVRYRVKVGRVNQRNTARLTLGNYTHDFAFASGG